MEWDEGKNVEQVWGEGEMSNGGQCMRGMLLSEGGGKNSKKVW